VESTSNEPQAFLHWLRGRRDEAIRLEVIWLRKLNFKFPKINSE